MQYERKSAQKERKVNALVKSVRKDIEKVNVVRTQKCPKRTQSGRKKGIMERKVNAVTKYQGF